MNVFVTGCGKIGAELAARLHDMGHDVVVIDTAESNFDNLPDRFGGLTFCGISIDEDVLVKAGVRSCDVLFAASQDDNLNLMTAQLAKTVFGIKKVIVRVSDSEKEKIFSTSGITTVCPTNLTVDSLMSAFEGYQSEEYFRIDNHALRMFKIPVPPELVGKRAIDITLEEGEILYAIISADENMRLVSNYNFVLNEGDTMVFSRLID